MKTYVLLMEFLMNVSLDPYPKPTATQFDTLQQCTYEINRWTLNASRYLELHHVTPVEVIPLQQAYSANLIVHNTGVILGNHKQGWYAFAACGRSNRLTAEGRAAVQSSQ